MDEKTKAILIIGAKGLAKEILYSFSNERREFVFYDDINLGNCSLYNKFHIVHSIDELRSIFSFESFDFVIGVGGAKNRESLFNRFVSINGTPVSFIAESAKLGKFENSIGKGILILDRVLVSNGVTIGKGTLINKCAIVSHDVVLGDFCEISPGVKIMGNVKIGNNVEIGVGSSIIPKITIGNNVTIGAGTIVVKDLPDNVVVVGNPGKIIQTKNI